MKLLRSIFFFIIFLCFWTTNFGQGKDSISRLSEAQLNNILHSKSIPDSTIIYAYTYLNEKYWKKAIDDFSKGKFTYINWEEHLILEYEDKNIRQLNLLVETVFDKNLKNLEKLNLSLQEIVFEYFIDKAVLLYREKKKQEATYFLCELSQKTLLVENWNNNNACNGFINAIIRLDKLNRSEIKAISRKLTQNGFELGAIELYLAYLNIKQSSDTSNFNINEEAALIIDFLSEMILESNNPRLIFYKKIVEAQMAFLNQEKSRFNQIKKEIYQLDLPNFNWWNDRINTFFISRINNNYSVPFNYHFSEFLINNKLYKEAFGINVEVGFKFRNLNKLDKALEFFEKAKEYAILEEKTQKGRGEKKLGIQRANHCIISTYRRMKNYDRALKIIDENIKLSAASLDNTFYVQAIQEKAWIEYDLQNYNEVIKIQREIIPLKKRHNMGFLEWSYNPIGKAFLGIGRLDSAIYYMNLCLSERFTGPTAEDSLLIFELAYMVEKERGNYAKALEYFENMSKARISMQSPNKSALMMDAVLSEEFYKKEVSAENEKIKEQAIAEQKLNDEAERKKVIIISSIIIACLLIGILFFINQRLRITKKQNIIIEHQKKEVEEKQHEIIDSINYAQRLQRAILATEEEIKSHFKSSFLLYQPKDIVAGDFYFFETTPSHIIYAAADCTGHGVPGAMVSVVCSNALTRVVKEFNVVEPGKILDKTRDLILETFKKSGENVKDGMDISLLSFNKSTGEIQWAGANNPIWFVHENEMKEIKPDKQPIGVSDNMKPFTSHILPKGVESLFLFTDGYADQFGGPKNKKFKYARLKELLLENSSKSSDFQKSELINVLADWQGDVEQVDDICVIGIQLS